MIVYVLFKEWIDCEGRENETFKAIYHEKGDAELAIKTLKKCEGGNYFIKEEEIL